MNEMTWMTWSVVSLSLESFCFFCLLILCAWVVNNVVFVQVENCRNTDPLLANKKKTCEKRIIEEKTGIKTDKFGFLFPANPCQTNIFASLTFSFFVLFSACSMVF